MAQQNMALLDQLYGRIMQLQFNEKQFITLLRELQGGSIELSQLKISDGGFEIMPTPPTKPSSKDTEGPQGLVRHDAEAGSDNNAEQPSKATAPAR